jgi:hypothetical protein
VKNYSRFALSDAPLDEAVAKKTKNSVDLLFKKHCGHHCPQAHLQTFAGFSRLPKFKFESLVTHKAQRRRRDSFENRTDSQTSCVFRISMRMALLDMGLGTNF